MNVKETAKKYYPEFWNIDRLKALVKAKKITAEEFKEITGEDYVIGK